MLKCDPLKHPSATVRRNNIVNLARRGGPRMLSAMLVVLSEEDVQISRLSLSAIIAHFLVFP